MSTEVEVSEKTQADDDELLDVAQAAAILKRPWPVLAMWRSKRTHALKFLKIGRRVYYRRKHIQEYLDSCVDPGVGPRDYHPRSGVRKTRATKRGARPEAKV